MKDVFISYTIADKEFAFKLHEKLTNDNISCFIDKKSIPWGANWITEIEKHLQSAKNIILILSPDYCKSEWATAEFFLPLQKDPKNIERRIRPLIYRDCNDKLPPFIKSLQSIDVSSDKKFQEQYPQMVTELKSFQLIRDSNSPESFALELESEIPIFNGSPILAKYPQQAFRISPKEIIESVKQQFDKKELAFRELGQNSVDAGATSIHVTYTYESGFMSCYFKDDGCGMNENIIRNNYMKLFDSSKELTSDTIGYFSLGRISAFCYDIEMMKIYTMTKEDPGYKIEIFSNMSGMLFRIEKSHMMELLQSKHGTLIELIIKVGSRESFLSEVKKINESIKQELCWVDPKVVITEIDDNSLNKKEVVINKAMKIPGKFSMNLDIELPRVNGKVDFCIGLKSKKQTSSPITLCIGKIPVKRTSTLPWYNDASFNIQGVSIILNSFQFKTNIGRNEIFLDTPFVKYLLPKLFDKVILNQYVKTLAEACLNSTFKNKNFDYSVMQLFSSLCVQSSKNQFEIPEEIFKTPFIYNYSGFKPRFYSIHDLDEHEGPIYYTLDNPLDFPLLRIFENNKLTFISLSDLSWDFQSFLENRYKDRLYKIENRIIIANEDDEKLKNISRQVNENIEDFFLVNEIFSNSAHSHFKVSVVNFINIDDKKDEDTPTMYNKSKNLLYLNYTNSYINSLVELSLDEDEKYTNIAMHFLIREIIYTSDLNLSTFERKNLLKKDLLTRFGNSNEIMFEKLIINKLKELTNLTL